MATSKKKSFVITERAADLAKLTARLLSARVQQLCWVHGAPGLSSVWYMIAAQACSAAVKLMPREIHARNNY